MMVVQLCAAKGNGSATEYADFHDSPQACFVTKLLDMPRKKEFCTLPGTLTVSRRSGNHSLTLLPRDDNEDAGGSGGGDERNEDDKDDGVLGPKKTNNSRSRKRPMLHVYSSTASNKAAKSSGKFGSSIAVNVAHPPCNFRTPFELYYRHRELQALHANGEAALLALGWRDGEESPFPNWQQSQFAVKLQSEWQSMGGDARQPFQRASSIDRDRFDAEMQRFRANAAMRHQSDPTPSTGVVQLV